MGATQKTGMTSASNLAGFILQHYGPMSHLKMQKMLYYAQAYHLAKFGSELFAEEFQAWMHGPVCREVYDILKDKSLLYNELHYNNYENLDGGSVEKSLNGEQFAWTKAILEAANKKSGEELEYLSHLEQPWVDAREGYGPGQICTVVIDKKAIKEFYSKKLGGKRV